MLINVKHDSNTENGKKKIMSYLLITEMAILFL